MTKCIFYIYVYLLKQGLPIREGVEISTGIETWTSLKYRIPANFSDGEDFTCQFTNSEGSASKTFKVALKSGFNAGIYVAIGIAVLVVVILASCLLRSIYLTKVPFSISSSKI